jgi:putative ATP-dependent endonuclease of OLD family
VYLKRVKVENFRGLDEFELELSSGLNVIVGENNVGKSAILDAIRLPLAPGSTGGDRIWPRETDIHRYNDASSFKIDLYFGDLSDPQRGLFVQGLNPNLGNPDEDTLSIHYEWKKGKERTRGTYTRWVGDRPETSAKLEEGALQRLSWTYLDALRDSSQALEPYKYSRIAKLLLALSGKDDEGELEGLIEEANGEIQNTDLVSDATAEISKRLEDTLGDYLAPGTKIAPSDADFRSILGSLRLQFDENGDGEYRNTDENGLGCNNLLYIATVLAELASTQDVESRLLLVEEPEAHLHPQYQTLLADYLATASTPDDSDDGIDMEPPQVVLTSHSPTVASRVNPEQLRIVHQHDKTGRTEATNFENIGLKRLERKKLRRHLDVTKAALAFAKGVILVEGICEELLLPVLARRLKGDFGLDKHGVSVIPIHGVNFETLGQLFGEDDDRLGIPACIVSDADPPKVPTSDGDPEDAEWKAKDHGRERAYPAKKRQDDGGQNDVAPVFVYSDTAQKLEDFCDGKPIRFEASKVTLEYDLADAGLNNPKLMALAWEKAHFSTPQNLTRSTVEEKSDRAEKTLHVWREICLSYSSTSKAAFAQELALLLEKETDDGDWAYDFTVPEYLGNAIEHIVKSVKGDR